MAEQQSFNPLISQFQPFSPATIFPQTPDNAYFFWTFWISVAPSRNLKRDLVTNLLPRRGEAAGAPPSKPMRYLSKSKPQKRFPRALTIASMACVGFGSDSRQRGSHPGQFSTVSEAIQSCADGSLVDTRPYRPYVRIAGAFCDPKPFTPLMLPSQAQSHLMAARSTAPSRVSEVTGAGTRPLRSVVLRV